MITVKLQGVDNVLRNINKQAKKMKGPNAKKGFIRAAAFVRRDMDKTPPLIPVDTGNLRGSWFTDPRDKGITMGFSANYAASVHYNVNAHFRRPNAGAFFFTSSLRRNETAILKEMASVMKL